MNERVSSDEAPQNSVRREKDAVLHPQSPDGPIQFVVVQQNPAEGDRETIGKFVGGLLNGDNDDENKQENPSGRKLTVTLGRHNLLIVIALLILAGSQVAGVLQRFYEEKRDERTHDHELDVAALLSAATQSAADIRQAGAAAQQSATAAQQAATAAQQTVVVAQQVSATRPDPNLLAPLMAALVENRPPPPSGEPKVVLLQSPNSNGGAVPSPYSPPSGTGERSVPVLADVEITPCFRSFGTQHSANPANPTEARGTGKPISESSSKGLNVLGSDGCPSITGAEGSLKFPGPIGLTIWYANKEKVDLVLLGRQAFLTTESRDTGTQGASGICAFPTTGYGISWLAGETSHLDLDLKLRLFWNREDKRNAERAWNNHELYVTLCSTYRFNDSAPIVDRRVYRVTADKGPGRTVVIAPDDFENVVVQ